MTFLFKNLRIYKQAIDFTDRVSTHTATFPRNHKYMADQLNRASLSIALNIAESTGRSTPADQRHFLIMARGSVHDCAALFDLCERKKLFPDPLGKELNQHLVTISRMLAGMINHLRDAKSVKEDFEEYGA